MSKQTTDVSRFVKLLCAFIGSSLPGVGFVFVSRFKAAWVTFLLYPLYFAVAGYVALYGPMAMLTIAIVTAVVTGYFGFWTYWLFDKPSRFRPWLGLLSFVIAALLIPLAKYVQRVETFSTPTSVMEPELLEGDVFALDKWAKNYQVNDLVMIKSNGHSFIRKIKSANDNKFLLTTLNPEIFDDREYDISQLKGKVLYLIYSTDPKTLQMRLDRLFVNLPSENK